MSPRYSELPNGHIRVLTIQPGEGTTPLSGVLRSVPLASAPEFEAVSYAWGTEEFTDTLNVAFTSESNSGEEEPAGCISVTPNVTSLLRCLRRATEPRVLWIDAICIDQANSPERSAQVRQMRQIYSHAQRVVIWLGLATENGESDRALRFLQRMGTYKKRLETDNKRRNSDEISEFSHDEPPTLEDLERGSDIDQEEGSTSLSSEFTAKENDLIINGSQPEPMRTSNYTPKFIQDHSSELGHLEFDDEGLKGSFSVFSPEDHSKFQEPITRNPAQERAEMAVELDSDIKRGASHVTIGYPDLYYMFGHHFDSFFHKRFQRHWAAVDDLLSRSWWSRVWVVQEVWSARGRAILQCGQQKIRWKTFQRAMSYHDAWDDMGDVLRQNQNSRAGIWTQLQRRYGLAIHLCKMRLLDGNLSDLLWNTWDRDATDPRDKVFAVLGLVGEGTSLLMSPDYGKGVRQVFCETASDIIHAEDSLDILLAAGGSKGECDDGVLPSWVPDWRKEANETRPVLFVNRERLASPYFSGSMDYALVFGHGYAACAGEKPVAWFGDNFTTLHTRAVFVDEVSNWCGMPQNSVPVIFGSIIDDACAVAYDALKDGTQYWWMDHEKEKNQARERRVEMRWRSWLQREGMKYRPRPRGEETPKKAGLQAIVEKVLCAGSSAESTLSQVVQNVMPLRRFFVTKGERYLSIGPASVRPGDKVFIIAGCNFPLILREIVDKNGDETGEFKLIGEAYVHGIMAGEVISLMKETEISEGCGQSPFPKACEIWREIVIR